MHLNSPKDMAVGLSLAGALLCFKLGAVFGPNPPSGFYRDLATAAAPAQRARPAQTTSPAKAPIEIPKGLDPAAGPAPTVATFIDNPATIGEVRVSGSGASTRVAVQLGPGQADPRLTLAARDGQPTLTVSGLASPAAGRGQGSGLVQHWELNDASTGGKLDLPLTAPARVTRAFLANFENGDRRLILDLAPACPVRAARQLQIVLAPPRAESARQVASLD
jgi:hypothetical protein